MLNFFMGIGSLSKEVISMGIGMGIGSLSKFDDLFGGGVEQYLPMLPAKAVKDKLPE